MSITNIVSDTICHLRISFMTTIPIQFSQVKCIDLNFAEKILLSFQFLVNNKREVPFETLSV